MRTAKLVKVEVSRNGVAFADARLSDGGRMVGVGFSERVVGPSADPTGKYDALWDLAQVLTRLGVEVEG